jgi:outer membrane protein assembly factor BamB
LATSLRRYGVSAAGVMLAIAVWSSAALADESTTVTTALAVEPLVGGQGPPPKSALTCSQQHSCVPVSANDKKVPLNQMTLGVYLGAIPADAKLTSCAFRLVTATAVPEEQYNGVHLQLFDAAQDVKIAKSLAAPSVAAGATAGSVVEFKSDGLCQALKQKIGALTAAARTLPAGSYKSSCENARVEYGFLVAECRNTKGEKVTSSVGPTDRCAGEISNQDGKLACQLDSKPPISTQFRLQTTNPNAEVSFWGRESVEPAKAPRLLLTYVLPNSWPGRADWAQPRRDAQQSGASPWRFYNDKGAYTPVSFAVRPLGDQIFANVSPPLLLYDRELVAVSGANVQLMHADGAPLRTIPLPVASKRIGISPQGWLYATAENKVIMQPLQGALQFMIDIGGEETVLDTPTIGDDGSLYLVTSKFVYRYPPPPVPPALTNVPLWRHPTVAESGKNNDVSRVALSVDGRTAYFVDKQGKAMIALDAVTGARIDKWQSPTLEISRGESEEMPTPVVAGGMVFVTNHAPTGSQLYIINGKTGELIKTISGNSITAPVVFGSVDKPSIYYLHDGTLRRWQRNSENGDGEEAVAITGCPEITKGADLLRADDSGNLYVLDRMQGALAVLPAAGGNCVPLPGTAKLNLGNLIVAPDGSMFGYSREQKLVRISPVAPGELTLSNQILKLSADGKTLIDNNDMTFRAAQVVTDPNLSLSLPANTNINIVAGNSIVFRPGLRIAAGARLHASVVGQ